jgi:hypothetical protein
VNPDVYGKSREPLDEVIRRISELQVADVVDWSKVMRIAEEQSGRAEDVTLFTMKSLNSQAETAPAPPPARSLPYSQER